MEKISSGTTLSSIAAAIFHFPGQWTTNGIHCTMCYCGGACCLLPILHFPESYVEDSVLRESLPERTIRDSSIAVIALAFPLVMDIVTEILNSLFQGQNEKVKKQTKPLLNNLEKLLFLIGTIVVPMTSYSQTNSPNWAYMYLCCSQCQTIMAGGAICISLSRYKPEYFNVNLTYLLLIILVTGAIFGAFTDNYLLIPDRAQFQKNIEVASYYLILGALIIFTTCAIRWLTASVPKFLRKIRFYSKVPTKCIQTGTGESLLFPIMFVITSLIAAGVLVLMASTYKGAQNYNVNALYTHNVAFVLFITYGSMRMMKYEVVQGLYALIESKKMYVRYISHELRTPLNSACLGLQLVSDYLRGTEGVNTERSEILQDVKSACRTAVEILDDLLCFDKLESGILEVHKHEVPVIPFTCDGLICFHLRRRRRV